MLEFKDLVIEFVSGQESFRAVDGVSFGIGAGETVCLVGESGCGKSVTALSVARLLPSPPARYRGEIWFEGREIFSLSKAELRRLRGGAVTYIFQDPANSLNPVFRIGRQIKEMLRLHRPEAATDAEVVRLLQNVGIPAPAERAANYPHELSGGMQQRVMIAMALAAKPKLLIADEPTTALDVTIQAGIIELLARLKRELGMAILLITHNLGIVGDIADRVAVMYAGQIVELGPARDVLARPLHPYTRALIAAVPRLNARSERLTTIPGTVASGAAIPTGCRFHPRCPVRQDNCAEIRPALEEISPAHWVRCPYTDGLARG